MLNYFIRKLKCAIAKSRNEEPSEPPALPIKPSLKEGIDLFFNQLGQDSDAKVREFTFGAREEYRAAILFVDGMVDNNLITEGILKPFLTSKGTGIRADERVDTAFLKERILCSGDITEHDNYDDLVSACINGETGLLVEGLDRGLSVDTKGWEVRAVTEPQTESVVRGPREGFNENLRTNTTLIRRKIRNKNLKMESFKIGRKTRTDVVIAYIGGVARIDLVDLVRKRLRSIKVDAIMDAGYIEEYIEDNPLSIFHTVGFTEKPDVAAAKMLEGRIAIIVDGSPFVLTVPSFFGENFQMSEDYYTKPLYASVTRILRIIAYIIAIFAVPVFIALTTFHQELIPTKLLLSLINAKEGTPFPVFFETLIMVIAFEILREAGLRLPRAIGQAISIVGALIIGEAAVAAGLVGTAVVITVALAAVAGYTVPGQAEGISMLRIIMIFLSALLGGFGIAVGLLALMVNLARMKSFGLPYLGMLDPNHNLQDSFIRAPLWLMSRRPAGLSGSDSTRLKPFYPTHEDLPQGESDEEQ